MKFVSIAVVMATMAFTGMAAVGSTIVVDWQGGSDYTTIQEALEAALDGDTIIVQPSAGSPEGAYLESIYFPAKAITLQSIDPAAPTVVSATVIDGNADGSVVTFSPGASTDTVLDGFTIRNGQVGFGGGVYCEDASPTIRRCTIVGNTAYSLGGGVFCDSSSPTIDRCRINGNTADYGGGVYLWDNSAPTLTSCVFSGNQALACG